MKILICIKQVPHAEQLKFDLASRRLVRGGVENEINPFDRRAITAAVQLTQRYGGEAVAITMGPPQAYQALLEALAMGCDRAVHLLGSEFAGADSLATARALAAACRKLDFDLILCGKYSTDAETAQVPPMLAELLDLPQVTGVTALTLAPGLRQVTVKRETDDGFEMILCPLPAVLSVAERLVKPIKVSPEDLEPARLKPVEVWGAADLPARGRKSNQYGVPGSPTTVGEIYSIETPRKQLVRSAADGLEQAVSATLHDLAQAGVFEPRPEEAPVRAALLKDERRHFPLRSLAHLFPGKPAGHLQHVIREGRDEQEEKARRGAIWVVAELVEGDVRPVTFEMLWRAHELVRPLGGEAVGVLIGYNVRKYVPVLSAYGADRVYVADSPALDAYNTETYTAVLAEGIRLHDPLAVLMPSTANGRDLAPRLAARLGAGLTGDCIGLELDEQERLVQLKPAFGGNIVAPILSKTRPVLSTIRPGILQRPEPDMERQAALVDYLPVDLAVGAARTHVISSEPSPDSGVRLESAAIVVGVGLGIGGPEHLPEVQALAEALGAAVGATRKVVDAGWLPRQVQIGLTGRSVAPRLYVALGTGGKFNHLVGVQRAGLILAINNDPQAEIFKHCDYGIVGDALEVAKALGEAVKSVKREA